MHVIFAGLLGQNIVIHAGYFMDLLIFVLNWQKRWHTAVTAPLNILYRWPSELPVEVHGS